MAQVNEGRIAHVAAFLKAHPPKGAGLNFYSFHTPSGEVVAQSMYPSLNHPQAVDFFFFLCLHQFGFWYGDDRGYAQPLVGMVEHKPLKGSDLLNTLFMRALVRDPGQFDAKRLLELSPPDLAATFFTDDGRTQWPDFEQRLELTRSYGRWLVDSTRTPGSIVEEANATDKPLETFLRILQLESPFGRDVWQKKALLLAMALANRPERFLKPSETDVWDPIVDYHLMRVALRLGLVDLTATEARDNKRRAWVGEIDENNTRAASWSAVQGLIRESGLSMAAIDETLWMARKYCPEMEEPVCAKCLFNDACAKRTELFQPVLRTTAY